MLSVLKFVITTEPETIFYEIGSLTCFNQRKGLIALESSILPPLSQDTLPDRDLYYSLRLISRC